MRFCFSFGIISILKLKKTNTMELLCVLFNAGTQFTFSFYYTFLNRSINNTYIWFTYTINFLVQPWRNLSIRIYRSLTPIKDLVRSILEKDNRMTKNRLKFIYVYLKTTKIHLYEKITQFPSFTHVTVNVVELCLLKFPVAINLMYSFKLSRFFFFIVYLYIALQFNKQVVFA